MDNTIIKTGYLIFGYTVNSIMSQISQDAEYVPTDEVELYYDDNYCYLFIERNELERECSSNISFNLHVIDDNGHRLYELLCKKQIVVFHNFCNIIDCDSFVFDGIYTFSPNDSSEMLLTPKPIVINQVATKFKCKLLTNYPNYLIRIHCQIGSAVVKESRFICNIQQNAKRIVYDEVLKFNIDDGEYYAELFRVNHDGKKISVEGMPTFSFVRKQSISTLTDKKPDYLE